MAIMATPLRTTTPFPPLAPVRVKKDERPDFLEPFTPPSQSPPLHVPCLVSAARGGAGEEPLPPPPSIVRRNLVEALRAADTEEEELNERRIQRYLGPPPSPPSPTFQEGAEEYKESAHIWDSLTQEEKDELNALAEAWEEEEQKMDYYAEAEYWADIHCGARCDGRCPTCIGYNGSGYEGGVDV